MQASRRASQKKKERNSNRISVEEKNVYAEEKKHFFFEKDFQTGSSYFMRNIRYFVYQKY